MWWQTKAMPDEVKKCLVYLLLYLLYVIYDDDYDNLFEIHWGRRILKNEHHTNSTYLIWYGKVLIFIADCAPMHSHLTKIVCSILSSANWVKAQFS